MKKERISLIAGFMPPACMAILMGFEYLVESGRLTGGLWAAALAEIVAFMLPFLLLALLRRLGGEEEMPFRLKSPAPSSLAFVLFLSAAVPIGAFLVNCLLGLATGHGVGVQQGRFALQEYMTAEGALPALFIIVALPAVVEELFFRSALLGCMDGAGTYAAILFSACSFALVHGSASNFAGPLLAGMVFGYMSYALGSVWPAVCGHLISNLYAWGFAYFSDVYEAFGLWGYVILVNIVCFCVLLYLAMRSLEKLIERGRIPRFKKGGLEKLIFSFLSPGFLLLVLLFVLKSFYL